MVINLHDKLLFELTKISYSTVKKYIELLKIVKPYNLNHKALLWEERVI